MTKKEPVRRLALCRQAVNHPRPCPTRGFFPLRRGRECAPCPIEVVLGAPGVCSRLRAALPPFVLTVILPLGSIERLQS